MPIAEPADHVLTQETESASRRSGTVLAAAGGVLAALAASSCCVVPFALVMVGVSGAWIGNLTALAPYQPYFAALAAALIGGGFWLVYRRPAAVCADGSYCARPTSERVAKAGLWAATFIFGVALAFPHLAPFFVQM